MQRGRYIHLAALAGAVVLAAGMARPAHGAGTPNTTPSTPILTPGDGRVLITFGGVPGAVGYNVYSQTDPSAQGTLVNAQPTPNTWLIDDGGGKGLKNGTPVYYTVKAVIPNASGTPTPGPVSNMAVTVPDPPLFGGLVAYTFGTMNPGSASYDPKTKLITVRAAGADIWSGTDQGTFVGEPVDGDFTITAKIPAAPTIENGGTSDDGKIGLMMRTELQSGAVYAMQFVSVNRDTSPSQLARFELRRTIFGTGNSSDNFPDDQSGLAANVSDAAFPIWLRLTRSGTKISAFQSEDGTKWDQTGSTEDFGHLPSTTWVGLGACAHDDTQYLDGQVDASTLTITTP